MNDQLSKDLGLDKDILPNDPAIEGLPIAELDGDNEAAIKEIQEVVKPDDDVGNMNVDDMFGDGNEDMGKLGDL